jgi:hypothetical protein
MLSELKELVQEETLAVENESSSDSDSKEESGATNKNDKTKSQK